MKSIFKNRRGYISLKRIAGAIGLASSFIMSFIYFGVVLAYPNHASNSVIYLIFGIFVFSIGLLGWSKMSDSMASKMEAFRNG